MTDPTRAEDDAVRIDGFEVRYDGDGRRLVCQRCGAVLHFSQGYGVAEMAAAGTEHVLTACLGSKEWTQ